MPIYSLMRDWFKADEDSWNSVRHPTFQSPVPLQVVLMVPQPPAGDVFFASGNQPVHQPIGATFVPAPSVLAEVGSWFKQVRICCHVI